MESKYSDFKNSLKYIDHYDNVKLLMIQRKLEKYKNDKQIISNLLDGLTEYEKNNLIQLYTNQIKLLNNSITNYKDKIIKKRKQIGLI